jgi:uncharacterized OB-fold protein
VLAGRTIRVTVVMLVFYHREAKMMTRIFPELTHENTPFWTGGERGELMIAHCGKCDHAIHPPQVICPICLSRDVAARPAKGTGVVLARTINRQQWAPDMVVPFALAIVGLDDEPGVRLTARVIDCDPETVAIGDTVTVGFENDRDIWFPVFRLSPEPAAPIPQ